MLMPDWLDPEFLINALGNWALWGVAFIVFAECGLFSLLPGDSLLFTVGMFVALGSITFGGLGSGWVLLISCVVLFLAAVLGNVSGYWLGSLIGPPLFKERPGLLGKLFDPKYVDIVHELLEKYGDRALILARFVPMVRTFVTMIAGIGKMDYRRFIKFTAIGGFIWVFLITILGYFLGQIPIVKNNLELALVLIVFVSIIPMIVEYINARRESAREAAAAAGKEDRPGK